MSAFQVGYYDRHCTAEKPEARQVRTHTQSRAGIQTPGLCSRKAHCKELLCQHHGSPRERAQPHCPAGKCTGGVGKGPESGAPHPGSSAPPTPSRSNPIHPPKHAPPHKPIPAHQPHHCSPTQTFKGTRGAHFMVCLALSIRQRTGTETRRASAGYTADESPAAWGLVLGSAGFTQGPEAELSSRDTAAEGQADPKLESSTPGTQVGWAAIARQAMKSLRLRGCLCSQ